MIKLLIIYLPWVWCGMGLNMFWNVKYTDIEFYYFLVPLIILVNLEKIIKVE